MSVPEGATHHNKENDLFYKLTAECVFVASPGDKSWVVSTCRRTADDLDESDIERITPQQPAAPQTAEADSDGWIEWGGVGRPQINSDVDIEVRHREGDVSKGRRDYWSACWDHGFKCSRDIVAYRRIVKPAEPAKAEPRMTATEVLRRHEERMKSMPTAKPCAANAFVTEGDRAGIKPAVDLSYFNPPPIEQKRQGAGLLTVWQPRGHL